MLEFIGWLILTGLVLAVYGRLGSLVNNNQENINDLEDECYLKDVVLDQAASWFDEYAEIHEQKQTVEGDMKAQTNRNRAKALRDAKGRQI